MACGFSESEADDLRRAVGKKQTEKLELYRPRWVAKCGEASWQTMTEQGLYAYPKAHATLWCSPTLPTQPPTSKPTSQRNLPVQPCT